MSLHKIIPWLLAAALVAGAVSVAVVVARAGSLPDGPVDIVWDRTACAHCRMHVGEPAFAAQLQTVDGEVLAFDDPGCLLLFQAQSSPRVHAIWFRHLREPRWLNADAVGFVRVEPTPMGFGLGAVDAGTSSDTLSLDQARRIVRVPKEQRS